MEVIKEKRGRVATGKHVTRPVTVHMRTVPALTPERAEQAKSAACLVGIMACIAVTGRIEASSWPP